jgi:thioredoxin reductase (NADPH)
VLHTYEEVFLATPSVRDTRRAQMFPILSDKEIDNLARFGEERHYEDGEYLARMGESSEAAFLVRSGHVIITQRGREDEPIAIHEKGSLVGELSQLSGRPFLVDARAKGDCDVIAISPPMLRTILISEAELGERIMRALILRRIGLLEEGVGGPVIVGPPANGGVLRLQGFLSRNGHPHQHLDPDTDSEARTLLERYAEEELPLVLCPDGSILHNPSEQQLARCIGLIKAIDPNKLYDVAIIGAGPAGLAAAVYAGSEGLSAIVLDCRAFGGQAGASARIENYLGFPTGISGMALMARAYNQAQKFGVEMAIPDEVKRLRHNGDDFLLELSSNETLQTKAVIIATGARYRALGLQNLNEFDGTSVHYWASPLEAKLCSAQEVALVGAGNSAGQAAVYLAANAKKVWLLARRGLEATMSRYLIDRINAQPNIEVLTSTELTALEGEDGVLKAVRWRNGKGEESRHDVRHLFLFIGADPNTDWLAISGLKLCEKGFIATDDFAGDGAAPLETNIPGVFAIGDVRSGSVKRVAAAVGEGAQVVAQLHAYLANRKAIPAVA